MNFSNQIFKVMLLVAVLAMVPMAATAQTLPVYAFVDEFDGGAAADPDVAKWAVADTDDDGGLGGANGVGDVTVNVTGEMSIDNGTHWQGFVSTQGVVGPFPRVNGSGQALQLIWDVNSIIPGGGGNFAQFGLTQTGNFTSATATYGGMGLGAFLFGNGDIRFESNYGGVGMISYGDFSANGIIIELNVDPTAGGSWRVSLDDGTSYLAGVSNPQNTSTDFDVSITFGINAAICLVESVHLRHVGPVKVFQDDFSGGPDPDPDPAKWVVADTDDDGGLGGANGVGDVTRNATDQMSIDNGTHWQGFVSTQGVVGPFARTNADGQTLQCIWDVASIVPGGGGNFAQFGLTGTGNFTSATATYGGMGLGAFLFGNGDIRFESNYGGIGMISYGDFSANGIIIELTTHKTTGGAWRVSLDDGASYLAGVDWNGLGNTSTDFDASITFGIHAAVCLVDSVCLQYVGNIKIFQDDFSGGPATDPDVAKWVVADGDDDGGLGGANGVGDVTLNATDEMSIDNGTHWQGFISTQGVVGPFARSSGGYGLLCQWDVNSIIPGGGGNFAQFGLTQPGNFTSATATYGGMGLGAFLFGNGDIRFESNYGGVGMISYGDFSANGIIIDLSVDPVAGGSWRVSLDDGASFLDGVNIVGTGNTSTDFDVSVTFGINAAVCLVESVCLAYETFPPQGSACPDEGVLIDDDFDGGSLDTDTWDDFSTEGTLTVSGTAVTLDAGGVTAWNTLGISSTCPFPRKDASDNVLQLTVCWSGFTGGSHSYVGFHKDGQDIDLDGSVNPGGGMDGFAINPFIGANPDQVRVDAGQNAGGNIGWNDFTDEQFARAVDQDITPPFWGRITCGLSRGALFELDYGSGFSVVRDTRQQSGDNAIQYRVVAMNRFDSADIDRIVVEYVAQPPMTLPDGTADLLAKSDLISEFNPFDFTEWKKHYGNKGGGPGVGTITDNPLTLNDQGNGNWASNTVSTTKRYDREDGSGNPLICTWWLSVQGGTGLEIVGLAPPAVGLDGTGGPLGEFGDWASRGHSFMVRSDNSTMRTQAGGLGGGAPENAITDYTQTQKVQIELDAVKGAIYRVDDGNDGGAMAGGWDFIDAPPSSIGSAEDIYFPVIFNGPSGAHDLVIEKVDLQYGVAIDDWNLY